MTSDTWVQPFLSHLAKCGIVARACEAASVTRARVMAMKARDADFAAAFEDAMEQAIDGAEAEAWRRGVEGYSEPLTHQGRISYVQERYTADDGTTQYRDALDNSGNPIPVTIRKFSDPLLALVLKGRRKSVFADRTELTGADGGAVKIDSAKKAERIAALFAMAKARRDEAAQLEAMAGEHGDIA